MPLDATGCIKADEPFVCNICGEKMDAGSYYQWIDFPDQEREEKVCIWCLQYG